MRIESLSNCGIKKVIAGGFSAAITMDQQVYVWGEGDFGSFESKQRLYMEGIDIVDCQIGKFSHNPSALALDKRGKVYSWGQNTLGQLGHGDQRSRKLPVHI